MLTNKDLLIQLLSEITTENKELVSLKASVIVRWMEKSKPGSAKRFCLEFSQAEAEIRLQRMRLYQSEILAWFEWKFDQAIHP